MEVTAKRIKKLNKAATMIAKAGRVPREQLAIMLNDYHNMAQHWGATSALAKTDPEKYMRMLNTRWREIKVIAGQEKDGFACLSFGEKLREQESLSRNLVSVLVDLIESSETAMTAQAEYGKAVATAKAVMPEHLVPSDLDKDIPF